MNPKTTTTKRKHTLDYSIYAFKWGDDGELSANDVCGKEQVNRSRHCHLVDATGNASWAVDELSGGLGKNYFFILHDYIFSFITWYNNFSYKHVLYQYIKLQISTHKKSTTQTSDVHEKDTTVHALADNATEEMATEN